MSKLMFKNQLEEIEKQLNNIMCLCEIANNLQ